MYSLLEYFPRNHVMERLVFCAVQRPTGSCVCFESKSVFPLFNSNSRLLLTVTPLCGKCSSQCYCVLTGSYFHSAAVWRAGWRRNMRTDAHSWLLVYPLTCVCVCVCLSVCLRVLRSRQTHTDTLGPEQWHATTQDVCHFPCLWEVIWCYYGNQM